MTLDRLKMAVRRIAEYRNLPLIDQLQCAVGMNAAERDFWRVAFQWRARMVLRLAKNTGLTRHEELKEELKEGEDLIERAYPEEKISEYEA